ncbi:MAG: hypothetical protein CSB28_01640, partial [Desulfobacterales bacterium]
MNLSPKPSFSPYLPPLSPCESLRREMLVAGYAHDVFSVSEKMEKLMEFFDRDQTTLSELSENDEKCIRQIACMCKRFSQTIWKGHQEGLEEQHGTLEKTIKTMSRMQKAQCRYYDYQEWREGLGLHDWQMDALFANLITLQLTKGCSNACRRCNEWALPQVRSH